MTHCLHTFNASARYMSLYKYAIYSCGVRFVFSIMGNKCVTPCTPTTPNLRNKIRCLYFCCLRGATIKVIHTHDSDDIDQCDGVSVVIHPCLDKRNGAADRDNRK